MIDLMSIISKRDTAEVIRLSEMIREYADIRAHVARIEAEQYIAKAPASHLDHFTVEQARWLERTREQNIEYLERERTAGLNNLDVCNNRLGLYLRFISYHKTVCANQVALFVSYRHYKNAKRYLTFLSKSKLQIENQDELILAEKEKLAEKYQAASKYFAQPLLTVEEVEEIGQRFKGGMHNPSFLKLVSDKELDQLRREYNVP